MGNFSREQQAKKTAAKAKKRADAQAAGQTLGSLFSDKSRLKKNLLFCAVVALCIAIPLSVWLVSKMNMQADRYLIESELVVNEVDITDLPDGIYYARYKSGRMSATVGVTVVNARMTEIAIYDYANIDISVAQALFDDVIEYQMLNTPDFPERSYSEIMLLKTLEAALASRSTVMPS